MGRCMYISWLEILSALVFYVLANRCIPRDYGKGSIVCVCNATHCDFADKNTELPKGKYRVFISEKSGLRFKVNVSTFQEPFKSLEEERIDFTITLNRSVQYQKVIGFGGAFTDSAGVNILSLSSKAQDLLLKSYFSTDGLQYNLGRVPMASCDFSTRIYSYDDVNDDFKLQYFKLAFEDVKYKIPLLKKAEYLSNGALNLIATPWSAPGWMKTSGNMSGPGSLNSPFSKFATTWSKYFVKFFEEYRKHSVNFWGLTVQNEPTSGLLPIYKFQTMGFTPTQEKDFVASYLGPALKSSGYGHLKLMIVDDQRFSVLYWANEILGNKTASAFVDGIGVHWYYDWLFPVDLLTRTHDKFPDKFILNTEACAGSGMFTFDHVILGSWDRAEQYASSILEDLNNWVSGWVDWNLALDLRGGPNWVGNFVDSPIIVNATADEFLKQPMYYAMGHFSKFVLRDSRRIDAQLTMSEHGSRNVDDSNIKYAAFVNGNMTVLVMLNRGETPATFLLVDAEGNFTSTIGGYALHTYVWWSPNVCRRSFLDDVIMRPARMCDPHSP